MESGEGIDGENERELHEFETKMKSLSDEGKYGKAIEFFEKNGIIIYKCHRDHGTFYSYKIMGICLLKYTRGYLERTGLQTFQMDGSW
jgi:hypothetical protein